MDDTTLGKLLAEVHREYAEDVFLSPSSMSVPSDRTGETRGKEQHRSVLFWCQKRVQCSQSVSLQSPTLKEWSIERGNPWEKALELLRSGIALVHRLGLCSDTGYEPNAMELNEDTELNDSVFSKFTDFQDTVAHFAPSSDHDVDDEILGKLLAEVHRDYADYRRTEGVNVSQSVNVSHGRSNGETRGRDHWNC